MIHITGLCRIMVVQVVADHTMIQTGRNITMTKDKELEIMCRLSKLEVADRSSASSIIGLEDEAHERVLDINEIDEELKNLEKDLDTDSTFLYNKIERETESIATTMKEDRISVYDKTSALASRITKLDKESSSTKT